MKSFMLARHAARVICLMSISCGVFAAESWHTSTIKHVYPRADGSFVLVFAVNAADCTNGNTGKYHYVTPTQNGMTDAGAAKIYAAALLAVAMEKSVQVAFDNATSSCHINRLLILD
jgi:hypothetical protein